MHAPAALAGAEIEIRRRGSAWDGTHVASGPGASLAARCYAALFGGLGSGDYEFRVRGAANSPVATVTVEAGRVAETGLVGTVLP